MPRTFLEIIKHDFLKPKKAGGIISLSTEGTIKPTQRMSLMIRTIIEMIVNLLKIIRYKIPCYTTVSDYIQDPLPYSYLIL